MAFLSSEDDAFFPENNRVSLSNLLKKIYFGSKEFLIKFALKLVNSSPAMS
jgi:hypothetical protein